VTSQRRSPSKSLASRRARRGKARRAGARSDDLLRLDVFQHLFASVAEEMGAALQRSSFSPNIRERRDFSCALFDHSGRMIGQASHLPVHLGSTPMSVQAAIARVRFEPSDVVVLNDPYAGGTHLPDITFVAPIFLERSPTPLFYCANRAHHADVGGALPGSMSGASDVHGEGLRIPPLKLVKRGRVDRELLELFLANMRVPREREGDLLAQWATCQLGVRRMRELAREHGSRELARQAAQLQDWSERLTRELLTGLPDGRAEFEDVLEEATAQGASARLRLCFEKRGERARFDFRATDSLPQSSRNATRAVTVSGVFYVLRTLLPEFAPANDGILRPLEILTRPGSLLDAAYPAGVAAGNVETSQRLVDVLFGALAAVVPRRVPAASAGTMSNFTFGGEHQREAFTYYETIPGGAGASAQGHGASALQTHMTNTRNTPVEAFEASYPARVLSLEIRRGSGGEGAWRGGDGLRKRVRFLAPVSVAFVGERQTSRPWGLSGGGPGLPGRVRLRAAPEQDWRDGGPSAAAELPAGGEIEIETPGGGGFGAADGLRACPTSQPA
jgi:N-methylhydantoinase B